MVKNLKTQKYMDIKSTRWLSGAMLSALFATGFTACTDDHFNINSDVLGKQSIWENIKSKPELSEYADILQIVKYSQTENKTTSESYADVLNGDQTFTVWAPVNGSFPYTYYKSLLASGNRDSIYKVEKELIRNNMTRYTHVINGKDSVKIDLFNAKAAWLNYNNQTLKNAKMTTPNIGSTNGVLHIVDKPVEYQYNLYEFMATLPELDSLNSFIKSFQTLEFDEYSSTKGPTVNGVVTYVDSVTRISNDYTNRLIKAYLEREDSNYVMVMPTNDAWKNTLAKTQKYFKYKTSYKQDVNTQTETGKDTTITGLETVFTQAELDSIVNLRSKNAIAHNLVFNANWQYEQIPITNIGDIRAADARKDSLLTTSGTKFKKTGTKNLTNGDNVLEAESFADMFGNADPIETSNGYAYIVNEFNYPTTTYAPIIDNSAIVSSESADNQCTISYTTKTYEEEANKHYGANLEDESIALRDSAYKYTYLVMGPKSSTSNPGAFFRVRDVLSCKYDIFVVIGYNTDYDLPNKFRAYISYDNETKRVNNEALKNPNEDALDAKESSIYNSNYFVNKKPCADANGVVQYTDTICIAKDFEFPISYMDIKDAYPVIQIKSNFTSSEKSYYSREIWVNSIILKPKE